MANSPHNPDTEAPEAINREQEDEDAQAQAVAEAAQRERPLTESVKVGSGEASDDVQDLVDHMSQMEKSGEIDMDAYRGERSDDDEDGELGPGGVDDDAPRGAP